MRRRLVAWNSDGKADSFVTVSGTNQCKVWDCISTSKENDIPAGSLRTEVAEEAHLKVQYSAIAYRWRKKKRKKSKDNVHSYLAAGHKTGAITLFDLSQARVVKRLKAEHSEKVTSLDFSAKTDVLYSCSVDRTILRWVLPKGKITWRATFSEEEVPTALAASKDGSCLAVAGTSIKVYDLTSQNTESVREFVGHSNEVEFLEWSLDGSFFVSGTSVDDCLHVWRASGKKNKKRNPIKLLPMDSAPLSLSIAPLKDPESSVWAILAVSESSTAYVWHFTLPAKKGSRKSRSQPLVPICTIKVESPNPVVKVSEGCLMSARFLKGKGQWVVLARGGPLLPFFTQVSLRGENSPCGENQQPPPSISLSPFSPLGPAVALANDNSDASPRANNSAAGEGLALKTPPSSRTNGRTIPTSTKRPRPKPTPNTKILGLGDQPVRKRPKFSECAQSLAERLREVELQRREVTQSKDQKIMQNIPDAASLLTVLEQALASNDVQMLELCLQNQSKEVVRNTMKRLPGAQAEILLEKLVLKFRTKPRRSPQLLTWIQALVEQHGPQLSNTPSLGALSMALEDRLQWAVPLLKLQGRLGLALRQIDDS